MWRGKMYPSANAAARVARVSGHTMRTWAAKGFTDYPPGFKPRMGGQGGSRLLAA